MEQGDPGNLAVVAAGHSQVNANRARQSGHVEIASVPRVRLEMASSRPSPVREAHAEQLQRVALVGSKPGPTPTLTPPTRLARSRLPPESELAAGDLTRALVVQRAPRR